MINFFSDFGQLKYVFAEIEQNENSIAKSSENTDSSLESNTEKIKLDILNEELKILNETNGKFLEENQSLKTEINHSKEKIINLEKKIEIQNKEIEKNIIDQNELDFLRLNLIYSSKCQKSGFKKGFKVGTPEYRECILRKGRKISD